MWQVAARQSLAAKSAALAACTRMARVRPAEELLRWYRGHRRDLPWRATRDPWAVWVSEVMLQQTRVEHVIPYFTRFLRRFPTPAALASSPVEEALALWSGLGYYRRVRLLHRAAQQVAATGGVVPADPAALRGLAGVGDYTAAAVASIAFGTMVPVLDGNVERVLCRWLGVEEDPRRAAVRRRLRAAAERLLDPAAPGDGNQALMELGATVCTPRSPRCGSCPLGAGCVALARGAVDRLPVRAPGRPAREVRLVAARVERDGRALLFRRGAAERVLPGTWELPWVEWPGVERHADGGDGALAAALAARYGVELALAETLGRVRHAITFRRLDVEVRRAALLATGTCAERPGAAPEAAWLAADELAALPASSLVRKALALPLPPARAAASPTPSPGRRRRRG